MLQCLTALKKMAEHYLMHRCRNILFSSSIYTFTVWGDTYWLRHCCMSSLCLQAEFRTSFEELYRVMSQREEFRWMMLRIKRMAEPWVSAIRSLAGKQNLARGRRKKVGPVNTIHRSALKRATSARCIWVAFCLHLWSHCQILPLFQTNYYWVLKHWMSHFCYIRAFFFIYFFFYEMH